MPRFFEDAANCFLEMVYVDMFCASVGLSTTYGISIFVWFLALCRVVEKFPWRSPVGAPVTRSSDLPHRFWQSSLGERPILTPTVKFPIAPRRFHRGQG